MEKLDDVPGRFAAKRLVAMDAAELLGMSERIYRRDRRRYEEECAQGLLDRRLAKASARRVPVDAVTWWSRNTGPAMWAGRSSTSTTICAPITISPAATPGPRPCCEAPVWSGRHPGAAPTVGGRASRASA